MTQAALWDLDGTLVDTHVQHWHAWRDCMESEGINYTHEQFLEGFGKRNDAILRARLGTAVSDREIQRIGDKKEHLYRVALRSEGVVLLPGAEVLIEGFKQAGLRQAIASSTPVANIEAVLDAIGKRAMFTAWVSAEQVDHGKPAPDVFLAAAKAVETPPKNCVVLEDASSGVEAGKRGGMKTVGVLTTHDHLDADLVVGSLSDLSVGEISDLLGRRK